MSDEEVSKDEIVEEARPSAKAKVAKKKAVVKKAVKKAAAKRHKTEVVSVKTRESRPKGASKAVVSDVFQTAPPEAPVVQVPSNSVLLFVNGREKGIVDTTNMHFGEFVTSQAQRAGIRSFSAYIDGLKADTSDAPRPMAGMAKVEIVAKDARA